MDSYDSARREMVQEINSDVKSDDPEQERARLQAKHSGQVWSTQELTRDFVVLGFAAPFVVVERLSDHKRGSLRFQHTPRFYWGFVAD